jgi:hypothetical protein
LYAVDDFDVLAFDVDATGLQGKRTLFPHNIGTTGAYLFADLELRSSEPTAVQFTRRRLQCRNEHAAATARPRRRPRGMINVLCGGMTAAHVTDPVSGKVFYASYGDTNFSPWAMTVQTFAANGLTLQDRRVLSGRPIDVDFGFGAPRRVARVGPDGLAVVTAWKFLVLMRSPMLRN